MRISGTRRASYMTYARSTHLHLEHAERHLEKHDRALVEEEVPDAQQDLHVHDAGEGGEEPVQTDQRQLCQQHTRLLEAYQQY